MKKNLLLAGRKILDNFISAAHDIQLDMTTHWFFCYISLCISAKHCINRSNVQSNINMLTDIMNTVSTTGPLSAIFLNLPHLRGSL